MSTKPADTHEAVESVDVSEEEYAALRAAVQLHHDQFGGPQILRAFCACGLPSGPGTLACDAFRKLSGG